MEDYFYKQLNPAQALTASYVAGSAFDLITKYNRLVLLIDFTLGSLTSAQYKIEFSPDGNTWYQEVASAATAGAITDSLAEHTLSATGKYRVPLILADRFIRVSVKGTGTVTGSSITVNSVLAESEN
jgi:hypothetical protein